MISRLEVRRSGWRARRGLLRVDGIEGRLGFAGNLDVIEKRCFYLDHGFSSIHDFARAELGPEKRQVRERLCLVRALESLPRLRKAFPRGKISFSAVREITRPAVTSIWPR